MPTTWTTPGRPPVGSNRTPSYSSSCDIVVSSRLTGGQVVCTHTRSDQPSVALHERQLGPPATQPPLQTGVAQGKDCQDDGVDDVVVDDRVGGPGAGPSCAETGRRVLS